jgi:hypothetical protein
LGQRPNAVQAPAANIDLQLLEAKPFKKGAVLLRYQPVERDWRRGLR